VEVRQASGSETPQTKKFIRKEAELCP
jgi:hypothetical protein